MYNKLRYNLIIIFGVIFMLIGCTKADEVCEFTYFGGQIVNPKSDVVMLIKDDRLVKRIELNEDNTFFVELDSISEGLYSFQHGSRKKGYEFQYIYFEPRDSILIHLNTWDFDESLVFSGRGAEKNNFLIALYLQNEKEDFGFSDYYNLNSEDFENRIASVESMNNRLYDELLNSSIEISPGFKELAYVAMNYPINIFKEKYPYVHKNRFQLDYYPVMSDNYYDYRKKVDMNNHDLISFAPYLNFISTYIYSIAHRKAEKHEDSNYTENVLNTIIENVKLEEFKNNLLRQAIYNDFRESRTACTINKNALKIFNKHCTNEHYLEQINRLAEDCERIENSKPIVDFEIASLDHKIVNIQSVIKNRKAVIYFWSPALINSEILIKRVSKLKRDYPSLMFVGINMYPSENGDLSDKYLDNQYLLIEDSAARYFLRSDEQRTILVNEDGIIDNSFTYLTSPHLERQLTLLTEN